MVRLTRCIQGLTVMLVVLSVVLVVIAVA